MDAVIGDRTENTHQRPGGKTTFNDFDGRHYPTNMLDDMIRGPNLSWRQVAGDAHGDFGFDTDHMQCTGIDGCGGRYNLAFKAAAAEGKVQFEHLSGSDVGTADFVTDRGADLVTEESHQLRLGSVGIGQIVRQRLGRQSRQRLARTACLIEHLGGKL